VTAISALKDDCRSAHADQLVVKAARLEAAECPLHLARGGVRHRCLDSVSHVAPSSTVCREQCGLIFFLQALKKNFSAEEKSALQRTEKNFFLLRRKTDSLT
jgi:hypothetical protein